MRHRATSFLTLWTVAVLASTAAFCAYLKLRVDAIQMGYELGKTQAKLARLREVKRVLQLEVASYQTPERVEFVARTVLGMDLPAPSRMLKGSALPRVLDAERENERGGRLR